MGHHRPYGKVTKTQEITTNKRAMRSALPNRTAKRNPPGQFKAKLTKDTPLSSKIVEVELGTTFSSEQSCIISPGHYPPRAELRKLNLTKTLPLRQVAEGHFPRAELRKRNFMKTYPQSRVAKVELWEDISPRVELWNYP